MMQKPQIERIQRFMDDKLTSDSVYEVIYGVFTKPRNAHSQQIDVHILAAERIATDMLLEAWRELSGYKIEEKEEKVIKNVGL